MYFGNNEYIQEQVILQEFNVSKNDLKDPKYLEKVKENIQKEKDIIAVTGFMLSIILTIVSGIITSTIIVPLIAFVPFTITIFMGVIKIADALPTYDKRREEIKEKVLKIKEKAEKMKDGTKGKQEIIDNCNKVLKAIDKEVSDEENKKREQFLNEIRTFYEEIYNIMNNDKYILKIDKVKAAGTPYGVSKDKTMNAYSGSDIKIYLGKLFEIAKYLNISSNKLNDRLLKLSKYRSLNKPSEIGFRRLFTDDNDETIEDEYFSNVIKEYKENSNKYYLIFAIDDTLIAYLPSINKIYYGDYGANSENDVRKSLYSYSELAATDDLSIEYDDKEKIMTYLKMVDKYHLIKE